MSKPSPWIAVTIKFYAKTEGSKHFSGKDRKFAMSKEDFERLHFGDILDEDLHECVDTAPTWDTEYANDKP